MKVKPRPYSIPVYRLQLVQEGTAEACAVTSPAALATQLGDVAMADREHVVCVHLDTRNRPIGRQVVSVGSLNESVVHPREVFKAALLSNANSVILAHNHPSGDVSPSRDDDRLTLKLAKAGELIGVKLIDHVIVAPGGGYHSYRDDPARSCLLDGDDS